MIIGYNYTCMKTKITRILIFLFLTCGGLLWINRDLFRFEQIFVYKRTFSNDADPKGEYILSAEQIALKPGSYQIVVEGSFPGKGSGYYLIDSSEEKLFFSEFPAGGTESAAGFTISGGTKQIRFGVSYDPETAGLSVNKLRIVSNHVLYKESILKHGTISGFFILVMAILMFRVLYPDICRRCFPRLSGPENERMILFILFLSLVTAVPYFQSEHYVTGDDLYYHIRHLRGIAASLRAGHFPVRVLLDWLENYGYGSGFYYPNMFLTIPGILILLGFHPIAAYEIFVTICGFFALLTMFLTIRRISRGDETAAYAGVILYAFAAYRLADTYYRAALGEIQAFIFLPMIIWGLFEIFSGQPQRWWIFAFAFTGLLWSHVISLALAGVITAVWAVLHIRRIFTDRRVFFAMLKAVLLTLALGAWFLLPMAEQSATNELKINMIMFNAELQPYGSYSPWQSLFLFFYDWNYEVSERFVYPGWPLLIIPLLRLIFLRRKDDRIMKLADELSVYGLAAMIMCTGLFPWKVFIQLLFRIQFAWRIMMLSTVLLAISCGLYTSRLMQKFLPDSSMAMKLVPVFILSAVCGIPILIDSMTVHAFDMDYYRFVERSNFLSGSEYLPVGLNREVIEKTGDRVVCHDPDFEMLSAVRKGLSFTFGFRFPDDKRDITMRVPLIYYTGYRGFFTGPDGKQREIPISKDDQGLITVTNGENASGTITVRYVKTAVQHAGDCITLTALLFCLYHLLKQKRNRNA